MHHASSKAERTRQFIIETTAGIFNTKGYAGTSMSDITEATGLTKGSIYGNFENKEEVALAVFDHNYAKISQEILTRVSRAKTYHDKLMVYVNVYHSLTRGVFPQGGCPVLNTAVEADDTNMALKDKAAKAILKWKRGIMNLIQGGIESCEFKPNVDREQVALSIIALIEGGTMIAKVTDSSSDLDQVLKTVELIINNLKT